MTKVDFDANNPAIDDRQALLRRIDVLSEEYRSSRDLQTANQLSGLRAKAGCQMVAKSAGVQVTAPSPDDRFATVSGLPEIERAELSTTTLTAALLSRGALIVRGLFLPPQVAQLKTALAQMPAAAKPKDKRIGGSPYIVFELLEVYRECGLLNLVRDYHDDNSVMIAERAKIRRQTPGYASIPWHQDVSFFGQKSYALNCWAAVTSCGIGNPGLSVLARRYEENLAWKSDERAPVDYGKSLPPGFIEDLAKDTPIVTPQFEAGDALLFDEMTMHQTALLPWTMDEQIVAISWFIRASHFPKDHGTPLAF